MTIESEPLPSKSFAKKGFDCGVQELNDYFKKYAYQNHQSGVSNASIFKGKTSEGEPKVLGYYTLSMASLESEVAKKLVTKLPGYQIPVALIGRLARHRDTKGKGVGPKLLRDAFCRIIKATEYIACIGVVVDAKDLAAENFYRKYGFVSFEESSYPRRMGLSMDKIKRACNSD